MRKELALLFCFVAGVYSQRPRYLFGGRTCGRGGQVSGAESTPRIFGGRNVTEGEMPWMVRLSVSYVDTRTETCGGFILDENWVVTAAHCLEQVVSVKVSAGRISYEWGSSNENEQAINVPITRLYMHPDFDDGTKLNDIGLIHLPQSLQFNEHVQPICVLDESSCVGEPQGNSYQVDLCVSNVTSAGWGIDESGAGSNYLKVVDLRIVPRDQCQQMYLSNRIFPQQICAQGHQPGDDTCNGDSGGPLLCFQNGYWNSLVWAPRLWNVGPRGLQSHLQPH